MNSFERENGWEFVNEYDKESLDERVNIEDLECVSDSVNSFENEIRCDSVKMEEDEKDEDGVGVGIGGICWWIVSPRLSELSTQRIWRNLDGPMLYIVVSVVNSDDVSGIVSSFSSMI